MKRLPTWKPHFYIYPHETLYSCFFLNFIFLIYQPIIIMLLPACTFTCKYLKFYWVLYMFFLSKNFLKYYLNNQNFPSEGIIYQWSGINTPKFIWDLFILSAIPSSSPKSSGLVLLMFWFFFPLLWCDPECFLNKRCWR